MDQGQFRDFNVVLCPAGDNRAASNVIVVAVTGELDLATVPSLRNVLLAATHVGCPEIVVDLREVTFIDATAVDLLLDARRRALVRGATLTVGDVSDAVRHVLRLLDLEAVLMATAAH